MAGDWIKMRGNLWDDPRVSRLCDLTDATEASVIGALYWLWATADQHTEDGCMPGLTLRQIDRKTGVPGFAAALCEIGWLRDDPQGVVIANFEEHNGTSAKRRCMDAQRKANSRSVSASDADKDGTDGGQAEDETRRSAELEKEKRREEKKPSVAEATGVPPTPSEVIFARGIPLLTAANVAERNARSMLAMLRKQHGDEAVVDALQRCAVAAPIEPVSWLQAALKTPTQRPRAPPESFRERDRKDAEAKVAFLTGRKPPRETIEVEAVHVVARAVGREDFPEAVRDVRPSLPSPVRRG